jgi:tetratricopeptide (TPR) repeat protein
MNLDNLAQALDQLKKKEIGGGEFVEYEERYQYFLAIAFALIFAGVLVSDRRGRWFDGLRPLWLNRLRIKYLHFAILIVAISLCIGSQAFAGIGASMREGNALTAKGRYDEALKKYQEALVQEPDNAKIHYNIGRALYKQGKYPEAVAEFQLCLLTKDKDFQAKALYNIGDCQFQQQQLDQAIGSYATSLLLHPKDLQAKQNLEFCYKEKQKQQSDSSKQKQQQPRQQQQQKLQPKPQPQQGQISKDQADRMLQALQNKERENLKKQKQRPAEQEKVDKDW